MPERRPRPESENESEDENNVIEPPLRIRKRPSSTISASIVNSVAQLDPSPVKPWNEVIVVPQETSLPTISSIPQPSTPIKDTFKQPQHSKIRSVHDLLPTIFITASVTLTILILIFGLVFWRKRKQLSVKSNKLDNISSSRPPTNRPLSTEFSIPKAYKDLYTKQSGHHSSHAFINQPSKAFVHPNRNHSYSNIECGDMRSGYESAEYSAAIDRTISIAAAHSSIGSSLYSECQPSNSNQYNTIHLPNDKSIDALTKGLNQQRKKCSDTNSLTNKLTKSYDSVFIPNGYNSKIPYFVPIAEENESHKHQSDDMKSMSVASGLCHSDLSPLMDALNGKLSKSNLLHSKSPNHYSSNENTISIPTASIIPVPMIVKMRDQVKEGDRDTLQSISSADSIKAITSEYYQSQKIESIPAIDNSNRQSHSLERSDTIRDQDHPSLERSTTLLAEMISEKLSNSGLQCTSRYIAKRPNEITVIVGDKIGIIETFASGMAFGINRNLS